MSKRAFLFPGQGTQYLGMGKDLFQDYASARGVFERADEVLGFKLTEVIFNGSEEDLQKTEVTQPAVLTVSIAVYRALVEEKGIYPQVVGGLSLGEYSALVAAGALSLEEALPLVQKRGKYMQEAVPEGKGSMAAVIGLSREKVEELCRHGAQWGVVQPSNYNCPGQIVISGEAEAVAKTAELARQEGAKRALELKVSAPFHCELLSPVEDKMARELEEVNLASPRVPVIANVNAGLLESPKEIKEALIKQVSHPVMWEDSMNRLLEMGYDFFLELGPGRTLTGFMRKISRGAYMAQVDNCASLDKLEKEITV